MKSLSGPDNSPEAREGRRRGLEEHYETVSPPNAIEEALRAELRRGYADPVVRECKFELILGGLANAAVHDNSFDMEPLGYDNVQRFPVERTRPPNPPQRAA